MESFSVYDELMSRLEALVRELVGGQFQALEDLWRIQSDLLTILVDVADETAELHRLADDACRQEQAVVSVKQHGWQVEAQNWQEQRRILQQRIELLAHVRGKARSTGDALAWLLFRGNERLLRPLSENSRVGSIPDEHARMGVLAIAQEMARNGAGFPILHDITNILRVGDVTFIRKDQNPVTVEVKTRFTGESESDDLRRYSVQVWGNEDQVRPFVTPHESPPTNEQAAEGRASLKRAAANPRLRRQLDRMRVAHLFQEARVGEVLNVGDIPTLLVEWSMDEASHNWGTARRLATRAKIDGFASAAADGAIFYAAVYSDTPIHLHSKDKLPADWLHDVVSDLGEAEIFYPPPHTDRNTLWFGLSLSYDQDSTTLHHSPFLLFPLEEQHIVDMFWGRLCFFVGLNVGKIVEDLEHRGFRVEYPKNMADFGRDFLRISKNVTLPNGNKGEMELRNTVQFGSKLLYEFLSLGGFGRLIESVARSSEEAIRNAHPTISADSHS
jgi:hypothetical protein